MGDGGKACEKAPKWAAQVLPQNIWIGTDRDPLYPSGRYSRLEGQSCLLPQPVVSGLSQSGSRRYPRVAAGLYGTDHRGVISKTLVTAPPNQGAW